MSSESKSLYLREDVYFEPLINQWYAWPYTFPPVPSARHLTNTHKRIMNSFVNNFQLHLMAAKQEGMAGSDFVDLGEDKVEDIRALLKANEGNLQDLIELSNAITHLDELLRTHPKGESLEPLYDKVPEPLRGFVELVYDLDHNPSYRLIEGLLYKSSYFKPQLQRLSFGMLSEVDERPFVFSTPRLPDERHMQLLAVFNDSVVDEIFAARTVPISQQRLAELASQYEQVGGFGLTDMFTETPPGLVYEAVEEGGRMNYLGHAGFMVETKNLCILVDPVIASKDEDNYDQTLSFCELPPVIDYVCVTHSHQDHANIETLLQIRHKVKPVLVPRNNGGSLTDPSLKLMLQELQFNVYEMDEMEVISVHEILNLPSAIFYGQ